MELIEMIGWVGLGFMPTLIFGNGLLARFSKRKLDKTSTFYGARKVRVFR